jgi:hypothetical protein
MKEVLTSILTDKGARDSASVEDALVRQAVASPWGNVEA